MNIVFPEFTNPIIQSALKKLEPSDNITALPADNLETACEMVKNGQADTMIAGIDYSSRDVILATRAHLGMQAPLGQDLEKPVFSGLAIMTRPVSTYSLLGPASEAPEYETYFLADMAACKNPSAEQLAEIVRQTAQTYRKIIRDQPRVALLSFSTLGSGGTDESLEKLRTVKEIITAENAALPEDQQILIDGELQLDAAINPRVGQKKSPNSPVAGRANILIAPNLNSGNLVYKTFEQVAGFTVAGPILQGFNFPVSDLSRGSTEEDILFTIKNMVKFA